MIIKYQSNALHYCETSPLDREVTGFSPINSTGCENKELLENRSQTIK